MSFLSRDVYYQNHIKTSGIPWVQRLRPKAKTAGVKWLALLEEAKAIRSCVDELRKKVGVRVGFYGNW